MIHKVYVRGGRGSYELDAAETITVHRAARLPETLYPRRRYERLRALWARMSALEAALPASPLAVGILHDPDN
jgi:hypothetical protein